MLDLSDLNAVASVRGQPLYEVVADAIRGAIDERRAPPGAKLPSTKAISEQLEVSLVTVHRALQVLVNAGVLRRRQGRGTFVHEDYHSRSGNALGLRFGLVFHGECSLGDSYHGLILEGVRQGAVDLGVDLVLLRYGEDWRNECHGLLFVNPSEELMERSPWFGRHPGRDTDGPPPIMVVGSRSEGPSDISRVDSDNVDIAMQAVGHLHDCGHTSIAFLGGGDESSNNRDRWAGFCETCDECGIEVDERLVLREAGWRLDEDGLERLVAMLQEYRPTAVFAAGYYFALNVYEAARRLELRVPEDLAVVGVDDPPSASHLSPPLTTVRQPLVHMGRLATRSLFDLIGDPQPVVQETTLKGELIVRASTVGS